MDQVLKTHGFLGEHIHNSSVVAVKTHIGFTHNKTRLYDRAILVIRTPFESSVAEFNRQSGGGHAGVIQGQYNMSGEIIAP